MFKYSLVSSVLVVVLASMPFVVDAGAQPASTPASPAAVIAWNAIAQRTAIANAKQYQTQSLIYIAFEQAAVYDAVVAISGRYQPYRLSLHRRPGASVDAAVAASAHDVLVHYFPGQQAALDADYASLLSAIPAGRAKDEGVRVGAEAAAGIIALRTGDGLEADSGFTMPAPGPGVWQLPAGQTPQTPWVAQLRPFMLLSPSQFRPGPPPSLAGSAWATELNEVKAYGKVDSTVRTPERTDIAKFWSTNSIVQYNTAFKQLTLSRGLDAVDTARLYAMGDLVGADALIACFDAKYHYLFWHPAFAVPGADTDGNAATASDPTWQPLLATPNHPEYPAAHGCLTTAEAVVFARFFRSNEINVELTSTVPGLLQPTRQYAMATDLVAEIINARVWGGIHYRGSVIVGAELGAEVAGWTLARYFLPAN